MQVGITNKGLAAAWNTETNCARLSGPAPKPIRCNRFVNVGALFQSR